MTNIRAMGANYYLPSLKQNKKDIFQNSPEKNDYNYWANYNHISGTNSLCPSNSWEYTQYQITNAQTTSNKEQVLCRKVRELYEDFKNGEITLDEVEKKLESLSVTYKRFNQITTDILSVDVNGDTITFEDNSIAEINSTWLAYFHGKKDVVDFAESIEKIQGVSNVEISQIEGMEYVDITVNNKHVILTKSISHFNKEDFNSGKNIFLEDELEHKGFKSEEIERFFEKSDRCSAYTNSNAYTMRTDIKVNGKFIDDIFELQEEVVFKRAENNIFNIQ